MLDYVQYHIAGMRRYVHWSDLTKNQTDLNIIRTKLSEDCLVTRRLIDAPIPARAARTGGGVAICHFFLFFVNPNP